MITRIMKKFLILASKTLDAEAAKAVVNEISNDHEIASELLQAYYKKSNLLEKRFSTSDVALGVQQAKKRFPDSTIYYLTDEYPVDALAKDESLKAMSLGEMDAFCHSNHAGDLVFLCAFESDEKLLKALSFISQAKNSFFYTPMRSYPTARYFHRNDIARKVLVDEYNSGLPKFEVADFENIIQAIDLTRDLEGDFVEIGVYKGSSAYVALKYMDKARIQKKAFFFDVFEGFVYKDAQTSSDALWAGTHTDTSFEAVSQLLAEYSNAQVIKSDIIQDGLPVEIEKISLCNLDVDIYEAVLAGLNKVAPLIVPGGIVIVEDQGHTPILAGAFLALKEFMDSAFGELFIPVHLASGQMFLIRK